MYSSSAVGRRGAVGGGHRDVHGAGARRRDDGERVAPPATLMEVPGFEGPKSTAVAPVKPVPLTVTVLVPPGDPLVGLTEVTVGAGL